MLALGDAPITWYSSPTSVATMSGDTATGKGGGTATITAQAYDCLVYSYVFPGAPATRSSPDFVGGCTCDQYGYVDGTATLTVLYPASLSIVAGTDSTTREATCNAGVGTGCGVTRSFTYQVLDQTGHALTGSWIASQQVWDAINTTSPNGLGITSYTTTCSPPNTGPCGVHVNSQGQFNESPGLSVCSTYCYSNGTCVTAGYTAASQTVHIGSYAVVQQLQYYCNQVKVNGH
jgi:hypothetical protein